MNADADEPAFGGRRIRKWIGVGLAGFVAFVVLLVGGLFAFLRTDYGLDRFSRLIESVVSSEQMSLRLGRLEGTFPERLKISDLELSDSQGVLLALTSAELGWRPLDLFRGRLEVSRLHLNGVDLNRLPAVGAEQDVEAKSGPPGLPSLPIDVVIRDVAIAPLRLDAAVTGLPSAVELAISGELTALRAEVFSAALSIERLDGVPARLTVDTSFDRGRDWLRVDVQASEPADGLVASLLDIPGRPAIRIDVHGEGPIEAWNGKLEAAAEDTANVTFDFKLAGRAPTLIAVDGHVEVEQVLPEAARPLLEGGIDVQIAAAAEDERIDVERLEIRSAAGTLEGSATFLREDQRLDGTARLALGAAERFRGLGVDLTYAEAAADLRFAGILPRLEADVAVHARKLASSGFDVGDLSLTAGLDPQYNGADASLPPFDFAIDVVAAGVVSPDENLNALLEEPTRLSISGDVNLDRSEGTIDALALAVGPITLRGTAEASFADAFTGSARLRTEPIDLNAFGKLAGQNLSGQAGIRIDIESSADNERRATISAGIEDFSSDNAELAALIGLTLNLDAEVRQTAGTGVDFHADLESNSVRLAADGSLAPELDVIDEANLEIVVEDLARFNAIAPELGGGEMRIEASAAGPIKAFEASFRLTGNGIAYQKERIDRVLLTVDASRLPSQAEGSISLEAESSMGALTVNSPFALAEAERLRLANLTVNYENALFASGDLTIPLNGQPIVGALNARSDRLERVGRRFDVALGGVFRLDARLSGDNGVQGVHADVVGSGLRYGESASPIVEVEGVVATLDAIDPTAGGHLSLSATVDRVAVGGGVLDKSTINVSGAGNRFEVRAETRGDLQGLTELDAVAEVSLDDGQQVVLRSLNALVKEQRLQLLRPARIIVAGDRMQVDDLAVTYGSARVEATLLKTTRKVAGRVTLRDLELAVIDRFAPETGLRGKVDADATLSGTPAAPTLRLNTTLSNLESREIDPNGAGTAINARISGDVVNNRARVEAEIDGVGETPFVSKLDVPLRFAMEPFEFAVVEDGPMSGSVVWRGNVGSLFRLLPIDTMNVGGLAEIDVAISGTPRSPKSSGRIGLTQGSLEYFASGTVLKPLDVDVRIEGQELRIARLDAGDAGHGRVTGRGSMALVAPMRVDVGLDIDNAVLVRRDDVTSRLSGTVDFAGTLGNRGDLRARIRNEATEIRLVDRLPPSVKTLGVVYESDLQSQAEQEQERDAPSASKPWLFLDVEVDMPNRVFIRGRGLDSEWAGQASVKGSADAPDVKARFAPLRGDFSFLGRVFTLEKGAVVVDGLNNPIPIDLTASYRESGFKALIIVSGTASQPKLTVTSEPALPKDEVLARVLFGKSSGKLTPAEAVQLASAAATLASGERGILDKLRDATGLDRLSVGGGGEEDDVVTVEAGRNIADGAYVGVEQGATANSSKAVVEVDITDSIKARSTVSGDGTSSVGVRWEWDY